MTDPAERLAAALADRYRIERELGQGGMATVFLAADLKHDRKVAIKVLKPELAAVLGAERFVQEIKTTASLSHPHILPLFDSGEAGGFLYYVMPYIQGETIREKLNRETQFGIEESVKITTDVADAVDYAHRHGVIHRDIKPENILLHDGRPMVMDFGIALAVSAAAGGRMTETGLSLGTPHYMSPEQATADKQITARSDVYSLASVLYEMLAGEPPHMGNSAQAIIMKIIAERAKPVTELRASVPPNVAAALAKALEKVPADRFDSAQAFADALGNSAFLSASGSTAAAAARPPAKRSVAIAALGGVAVVATALALWGWFRPAPRAPVTRFVVSVPDDRPIHMGQFRSVDLSKDGARFAYIGIGADGVWRVYVRELDSFEALPVAASDNVLEFSFSPTGTAVVVQVGSELRVTGWRGESPRTISDSAYYGPVWGDDGFIYFTDLTGSLVRTPAAGGRSEALVPPPTVGSRFWTDILPGGKGGIFVEIPPAATRDEPTVMSADFASRSVTALTRGSRARYHSGRLIIQRPDGSLWGAPFDTGTLSLRQDPIALALVTAGNRGGSGRSSFALSAAGTLIVPTGTEEFRPVRLRRDGTETPYPYTLRFTQGPRLSPDGTRLAATLVDGSNLDVYVVELQSGATTRLTFEGSSTYPEWTADGRRVAFYTIVDSAYHSRIRAADASSPAEPLVPGPGAPIEIVFLPDGRSFITREGDRSSGQGADLVRYDRVGDSLIRTPLTTSTANERSPVVSPDGRYVAYVSDEGGRDQVYVRETRPSETVWTISREGGTEPLWARSGRELFYRGGGKLKRVGVQTEPRFATTEPARDLFPVGEYLENYNHTAYGILPGDNEFVFIKMVSPLNRLVVVVNWMQEVDSLLARSQ